MDFVRGSIWYVESGYSTGSEQRPGRPAIIVSNDANNKHSSTVEMVYLTTAPKHDLPTHVTIRSTSRVSTAICEQITTVATERIGSYCGTVTDAEMSSIETAMLISLGLAPAAGADSMPEARSEETPPIPDLDTRLAEAEARCKILQELYDSLLTRLIKSN
jgi:mRNA interferase MazF